MLERINIIELASNLAHEELINEYENLLENKERLFPNGIFIDEDEETTRYSEEAQDIFNSYYDKYLTIIEKCKE
jgi:hypothetical protein